MKSQYKSATGKLPKFVTALVMLLAGMSVVAALVSRTITIDGDMSDWYAAPDITNNSGQFSDDCEGATAPSCDADYQVKSTGRDLRKFSYTWDNTYLYFYVERWASSTNTTDWLFYLDQDADGLMQSDEPIFRVSWQGSNQKTNAYLCPYFSSDPAGDPMVDTSGLGDGYTMPGSSQNSACNQLYSNVKAGSNAGVEMESRVSWAQLGLPGPANMLFHISSSTGMNLPSQVIDNMDGPGGGGGLFPPDMDLAITADQASVNAFTQVTFDIVLTHINFADFTDIDIDLALPAQFDYDSHTAPVGTSFVDTDSDGDPDQWQVPLLQQGDVLTLEVTATAQQVPFIMNAITTATISAWTGSDSDPSNNTDSVSVEIRPAPELSVTKVASQASANPSDVVSYTVLISNTSSEDAVNVVITDELGDFTSFGVDTYGAGQPFDFVDGSPSSTLTPGTPSYSSDGGSTWTHTLAPSGYDSDVTHFRLPMTGTMPGGSSFSLHYDVQID